MLIKHRHRADVPFLGYRRLSDRFPGRFHRTSHDRPQLEYSMGKSSEPFRLAVSARKTASPYDPFLSAFLSYYADRCFACLDIRPACYPHGQPFFNYTFTLSLFTNKKESLYVLKIKDQI